MIEVNIQLTSVQLGINLFLLNSLDTVHFIMTIVPKSLTKLYSILATKKTGLKFENFHPYEFEKFHSLLFLSRAFAHRFLQFASAKFHATVLKNQYA